MGNLSNRFVKEDGSKVFDDGRQDRMKSGKKKGDAEQDVAENARIALLEAELSASKTTIASLKVEIEKLNGTIAQMKRSVDIVLDSSKASVEAMDYVATSGKGKRGKVRPVLPDEGPPPNDPSKPWIAAGMSRSKYYRMKRDEQT